MNVTTVSTNYTYNATADEGLPYMKELFAGWHFIETLLIIVTNGLTLVLLCKYAKLETTSNVLIAWLTIVDLLSAASFPFVIAFLILPPGPGWTASCFVHVSIVVTSTFLNSMALCAIAVDQLMYIICALRYHTIMSIKRAYLIIAILSPVGVIYISSNLAIGYTVQYDNGLFPGACISHVTLDGNVKLAFAVPLVITNLITIGCHIKISLVAWEQKRAIALMENPVAMVAHCKQSDFRVSTVMRSVVIVYLGCNLLFILQILFHLCLKGFYRELSIRIVFNIWRVNAWVNPFIYVWKSKRFRGHAEKLFKNI